jgi:hypothetical protein
MINDLRTLALHISGVDFRQVNSQTALCLLSTDKGAVALHCRSDFPADACGKRHQKSWLKDALRQQRKMPEFCSGQSELCVFPEVLIRFGATVMCWDQTIISPKNDENRPHISATIVCKKLQVTEMQNQAMELNSVIYNAANQSFEALATVYAGTSSRGFACANNAPIDIILKTTRRVSAPKPCTNLAAIPACRLFDSASLPRSYAQDARSPAKPSMHLTCCASWPRNQFAIATPDDRFFP